MIPRANDGPTSGESGLNVGLVLLGEAGNLGDDLILVAVLEALGASETVRSVKYLSHGSPLDWQSIRTAIPHLPFTSAVNVRYEYPVQQWSARVFEGCDLVLLGGGGLLQDTHHPIRPYHWLRFLPRTRPAFAIGLGLGPLSTRWKSYLAKGSFFNRAFLRDHDSIELAHAELGWDAALAHDLVDAPFLRSVLKPAGKRNSLGVALRAWPGLDEGLLSSAILGVVQRRGLESVEFFVLESKQGEGVDVALAHRLAARVSTVPVSVKVYSGDDPLDFASSMIGCAEAISMKLHSSAIWGSSRIPIHPVVYAPKVASLFGVPWRGLEIFDDPIEPDFPDEPAARTRDRIIEIVGSFAPEEPSRRVGTFERFAFQIQGFGVDIARKVAGIAHPDPR